MGSRGLATAAPRAYSRVVCQSVDERFLTSSGNVAQAGLGMLTYIYFLYIYVYVLTPYCESLQVALIPNPYFLSAGRLKTPQVRENTAVMVGAQI